MALITRFARLFRADMHAVLDRLEEPDVLLRQALREMEEDVAQRTRQHKARELERQQVEARVAELEASTHNLESELDLCFQAGNETLARTLLRRKLEAERLAKQLAQHLARLAQIISEQNAALDQQRRRLEDLRQRAAVFEQTQRSDCTTGPWSDDMAVSEADVELALLREKQKRSVS